jgi:hypothetical protein
VLSHPTVFPILTRDLAINMPNENQCGTARNDIGSKQLPAAEKRPKSLAPIVA